MAIAEPIRSKKQVREMTNYYLKKGQIRNYALILMGVHPALRISDLLRLDWDDVYDFEKGDFLSHTSIVEKKTGKPKVIALNRDALRSLELYASVPGKREPGRRIFESNRKNRASISRIQAYRLIRAAAEAVEVQGRISCHSLRKTFGYPVPCGGNLRFGCRLFCHGLFFASITVIGSIRENFSARPIFFEMTQHLRRRCSSHAIYKLHPLRGDQPSRLCAIVPRLSAPESTP